MSAWILIFYAPVALVLLVGIWQMAFPLSAWKLRRLESRTKGLATTDVPDEGALRVIRWQGLALTLLVLVFAVALSYFFRGFR